MHGVIRGRSSNRTEDTDYISPRGLLNERNEFPRARWNGEETALLSSQRRASGFARRRVDVKNQRERSTPRTQVDDIRFPGIEGLESSMLLGNAEAVISCGILGAAVSARPVGILFGYLAGCKDSRILTRYWRVGIRRISCLRAIFRTAHLPCIHVRVSHRSRANDTFADAFGLSHRCLIFK